MTTSNYRITITGGDKLKEKLDKIGGIEKIVYKWMASGNPTQIMQVSFDKNFRSEGRPRWEPLAESTIKSRIRSGFSASPILARTGSLRDAVTSMKGSIKQRGKNVSVEFGEKQIIGKENKKKYRIHQSGTRKIPSRKMVMFNNEDIEIIANNLSQWIYRNLK